MRCAICGNETGIFKGGKKLGIGYICEECQKYLPQYIKTEDYSSMAINRLINWNRQYLESYQKHFTETSCYGDLHVDDAHGLFAFYPQKYRKMPKDCTDIFNILLVSDYSFSMRASHVSNQNKACGTAEFVCELNNIGAKIHKVLKPSVVCHIENVDSEHYRVVEPADLSLMRSTFVQAINNAAYKYNQKFRDDIASKESLDLFRSKCMFMVGDSYTKEEIIMQKKRLLRTFSNIEDGEVYVFMIKNAYNILKDNLKEHN